MRSYVSTGLALALVTSLGLAACNDEAEVEDVEVVPPAAEETVTDPAVVEPVEPVEPEPVAPQ